MDFQQLLVEIARILENLKIPYLVTGGYAVSIWGRPRSTLDIDVVIELPSARIKDLTRALRQISEISHIDEQAVEWAVERKSEFNFVDIESGIKVDFWVTKNDAYSGLKMKRATNHVIAGQKVSFISPEDLILAKLLWNKENASTRQLEDIESVLIIQKRLDLRYVRKWAKTHGTLPVLEELLAKVRK